MLVQIKVEVFERNHIFTVFCVYMYTWHALTNNHYTNLTFVREYKWELVTGKGI